MHNRILVAMEQYTLLQHPFLSDTCAYRRLSHRRLSHRRLCALQMFI